MKEQVQTEGSLENKLSPFKNEFEKDVFEGLKSSPKHLMSKYFMTAMEIHFFQEIMKLPGCYLTNHEFQIFKNNKNKLSSFLKAWLPFFWFTKNFF